jgi:hypothetical protein
MLIYYNKYFDDTINENPFVKEIFNQENSKMIFENSKLDIENRIKLEKHKLNEIIKKEKLEKPSVLSLESSSYIVSSFNESSFYFVSIYS